MPSFIAIDQMMYEKSVTNFFYTLQYFGAPGGPPELKFANLGGKAPVTSCQTSCPSENPSTRYLLLNFIDFVDGVTHAKK